MSECPAEFLCSVCKDVVSLAVMMPCCAGSACEECAKNNIDIYGSCPLCLAHSKCEDLIPYRMLRDKVKKYLESIKKNQPPDGCPCHPPLADLAPPEEAQSLGEEAPVLKTVWLQPEDDPLFQFEVAMREIDAKKSTTEMIGSPKLAKNSLLIEDQYLEDVSSDEFDVEDSEKDQAEKNLPGYEERSVSDVANMEVHPAHSRGESEEDSFEEAANNEEEIQPKTMEREKEKVKKALEHALRNMDNYDEERIAKMSKLLEASQSKRKSKRKKEKKKKHKKVKIKEKTLKKLLEKEIIKEEVIEKLIRKKKKKKNKKRVSEKSSRDDLPLVSEDEGLSQGDVFQPIQVRLRRFLFES